MQIIKVEVMSLQTGERRELKGEELQQFLVEHGYEQDEKGEKE